MKPIVSVVMTVRNVEKYIADCLISILDQTFNSFEIVVIDDLSSDSTKNIILDLNDKRIRYYRNEKWLGLPISRNRGIRRARGAYLFFTDGDCAVSKDWITKGLEYLKDPSCLAVEGRIIYVSKNYKPTFSDHVMENRNGGNFMTGNMAYKRTVFENVGCFDEKLSYFEDRDLALRIIKNCNGKIRFNPEMIVYHPRVVLTPKKYIETAATIRYRVHLFEKFGEKNFMLWRIFFPTNLIKILFPPIIFSILFVKRFNSSDDFRLLPFIYIYVICQRLHLWRECAKEKVFLI